MKDFHRGIELSHVVTWAHGNGAHHGGCPACLATRDRNGDLHHADACGAAIGRELVTGDEDPLRSVTVASAETVRRALSGVDVVAEQERQAAENAELRTALRSLIDRVRRAGGYATPEDQAVLWRAEQVLQ